jgi:probable phosphoglycerate mutase
MALYNKGKMKRKETMKKYLYLMRHGQTIFNQKKRIQGCVDSPLTDLGKEQALHTKEAYFDANQIEFDHAFSSTQERASDTLELVWPKEYERLKGLKEMNFGKLDGEPEYLNPPVSEYDYYFKNLGGESRPEVRERMNQTLLEVMNRPECTNVLAISHGAACAAFYFVWQDQALVKKKERFYNCCVQKYEFDTDTQVFTLLEIFNDNYTGE